MVRPPAHRHLVRVAAWLVVVTAAVFLLACLAQHSLVYHPRPYDASYARALPPNGSAIEYMLPFGKQTAFYVAGKNPVPRRLWLAFCGNGSLALDWTTILRGYPENEDAFLLVDYPGYGRNSGSATIASTRQTADGAVDALSRRLGISSQQLVLCVIGHSLGAAAALDFSAHHAIARVVAIAPFTTLREEAATIVGDPLSYILLENYDNRARLREIVQRNPSCQIALFHGLDDDLIPATMGRELAKEFPEIQFFPVPGAGHVSVLERAKPQIIAWMCR